MKPYIFISLYIWLTSALLCGIFGASLFAFFSNENYIIVIPFALLVSLVASFPAFLFILIVFPVIRRFSLAFQVKWQLVLLVLLIACVPYGILLAFIEAHEGMNLGGFLPALLMGTGALWLLNIFSVAINYGRISRWLSRTPQGPAFYFFKTIKSRLKMTNEQNAGFDQPLAVKNDIPESSGNRILIKGSITALLILLMLVPASYTSKLVDEREARHLEVVKEVSQKWASSQNITTPYLLIPYLKHVINDSGKVVTTRNELFVPAKSLDVNAVMQPEIRKRSIYEVLLYRSTVQIKGSLFIEPGAGILPEDLLLNETMLCSGISDLQGVEEKITAVIGNENYDVQPGLPKHALNESGVSVPVRITPGKLRQAIPFSVFLKLKGSEKLHFLPLAEQSTINISSPWTNPSFDGTVLPDQREVTANGFSATWRFNKANMPLINQLSKGGKDEDNLAFGVTMIQPSDQYAKTNRSVKYAILFIGLSFAMFFITELVQIKQVHPVQYVLIGIALVIFYTLLLSIGEFTGFNIAYGIASVATVGLVGLYAVQLFRSVATGSLLGSFLGMLYGYIYILIQLEDTALLAGSIGLFVLLAVAMHFSRKIKWYPQEHIQATVI